MKLFVRDITVIDSSLLDMQRGILGECWKVDLILGGQLNEQSMLFDFAKVKKLVKKLIDQEVDHRLLIPAGHPGVDLRQQDGISLLRADTARGEIFLNTPPEGLCLIPGDEVSMEAVEQFLVEFISARMPENVAGLEIKLRREEIDGAEYQYSPGLKKHDGNCQRIAHGHRSRIDILVDGQSNADLEHSWAERWNDIYLGTEEDCCSAEVLEFPQDWLEQIDADYQCFSYRAPQGLFQLAIPRSHCEVLPCDTTVEHLAEYIADQLKPEVAGELVVYAYEGIGKGAIATR